MPTGLVKNPRAASGTTEGIAKTSLDASLRCHADGSCMQRVFADVKPGDKVVGSVVTEQFGQCAVIAAKK